MAKPSNEHRNPVPVTTTESAADILLGHGYLKDATALRWIAMRRSVFAWLECQGVPYESTRSALVAAIADKRLVEVRGQIIFLYLIGTLAEWDDDFELTSAQAEKFRQTCENVSIRLRGAMDNAV